MLQKGDRKGALHRMKINEVEQQVGITKKNIRFYEQQGLLHPKRNSENGYREYDETDVECLKKIKLLRKLSLPIEEIKKIQNGDLQLTDALRRQLIVLEREQTNLTETAGLCRLILEDETLYHTLSLTNIWKGWWKWRRKVRDSKMYQMIRSGKSEVRFWLP